MTKSLPEIAEYILGFDFIRELIIEKNKKEKHEKPLAHSFIGRNPKSYFEYLEQKYEKIYF